MMKGNRLSQFFQLPAQQPNLEVRQVLQQHNDERSSRNLKLLQTWVSLLFMVVQDLEDHITQREHQHKRFAAVLIVPPDKTMVLCFDHTTKGKPQA